MTQEEEDHIKSILAETVHTAFRKGADSTKAHEAWTAIRDMPDYSEAIDWMLWALDYSGYQIVKKAPSSTG